MPCESVVIVEDQVTLEGEPLKQLLEDHGFNVVGIANDAASAIGLARDRQPSLVLMDIMLHDDKEGGLAAARQIRGATEAEIIYVTGADVSEDLMRKVSETRPFGFITKPWTAQQVLATLELFRIKREGKKVVFVCYAHEDRRFKDEICAHLNAIRTLGVDSWDDRLIRFGEDWREKIGAAVERADAAIFLVSVNFINSRFIQDFELPMLLEAGRSRGLEVLAVYVGSVPGKALEQSGLTQFRGINGPDDHLDRWDKPKRAREAWTRLCNHLTG